MGHGAGVLLTVEFGFAPVVASRAANVTLPRIVPASRRPAARTPVRWTLSQGMPPRREMKAPRSA